MARRKGVLKTKKIRASKNIDSTWVGLMSNLRENAAIELKALREFQKLKLANPGSGLNSKYDTGLRFYTDSPGLTILKGGGTTNRQALAALKSQIALNKRVAAHIAKTNKLSPKGLQAIKKRIDKNNLLRLRAKYAKLGFQVI